MQITLQRNIRKAKNEKTDRQKLKREGKRRLENRRGCKRKIKMTRVEKVDEGGKY